MSNKNKVLQIGSINLHSLTNDAHFMYMKDVVNAMEADEAVKGSANVKARVETLKAAVDEEDEYLILSKKSAYTDQIAAKDRERDSLFRGYAKAVKGFLRMPVAEMAKASAELNQHLKDYAINPDMQLERETARIMNLTDDLDTKFSSQVALLGLKPYVDALSAANKEVQQMLASRTDDRSQQVAGALRTARVNTDEAYQDAVMLINAVVVVGSDKDFTPLINFLNANIKRYKEQVMTQAKKQDDDANDGGGDNDDDDNDDDI